MPTKKKKFIDKKKAVTFHLVHRSQKDPLVADETAPQHVLLAVGDKQKNKVEEKKKEEQMKYGIFFDDNYDYLQHLRSADEPPTTEWEPVERFHIVREDLRALDPGAAHSQDAASSCASKAESASKLQLPSSVFASHIEEEVGLLNRAAPESGLRLDLDPDIVAAMDDDFDFEDPENLLEDNFLELANASGGEEGENGSNDEDSWSDASDEASDSDDYNEEDEVMSLNGPQLSFSGEETKSRFTEYSMTSSVIRRNNQLTLLDSRFEQMFAGYDDTEIGALDCDEIEGPVAPNSKLVLQCAEEFARDKEKAALETGRLVTSIVVDMQSDSEGDDDMIGLCVEPRTKERWDCESILSTRSTLYNHPKLIPAEPGRPKPIRISAKTGIPVGVLSERRGLTARALASLDAENKTMAVEDDTTSVALSVLSTLSIRPKGETPQERQARKHNLKEYRKERRMERKSNKIAFKEEKKKQEKLILHNRTCANTVKII